MILVGIDDTDVAGSRGTNQLARRIVRELSGEWRCVRIVRHQLLEDPRVPCTTKNGSASIALERRRQAGGSVAVAADDRAAESVLNRCRTVMRDEFITGSDPGLCLLPGDCPPDVIRWGERCQHEFVSRDEAMAIAADGDVHLEALGGTEDGVIGALAAVGLAATQNDGRIVQLGEWPDDLSGMQTVRSLSRRGVCVRDYWTGRELSQGTVDVGKRLRPNVRQGEAVLFVEPDPFPAADTYRAIRLP